MHFSFEILLTSAVFLAGFGVLIDQLCFAAKRKQTGRAVPLWAEYARSFFPILLIVLFLRSFLFEPFRIPTGSLKPTLQIGDFVLTSKFSYGVRLPVLHNKIIKVGEPKRGDIAVFRYPVDPRQDFIKRIVGMPGDRIKYIDKILYINGQPAEQTLLGYRTDKEEQAPYAMRVMKKQENLMGVVHDIYQYPDDPSHDMEEIVVPPGHYFMMGDNRDNSGDSRVWGFVPETALIGKALLTWFSWDHEKLAVRWNRLGQKIQ